MRSKQALVRHNEKEIELITQEISFQVENAKEGALYVEDIIGRELRTASIAIKNSLPANHEDVTNEQLKALADELMLSHITLLAKTEDDIIGVKSSDLHEINMSTKEWGYWYEAFQQLFSLSPVKVEKGVALPNYWTGPIEKASTNPHHTDKWGYFYDGSTNYIINPYFRDDQILKYEKQFGPGKVIDRFTSELEGVLELTVFNPAVFGKEKKVIYKNGNSYVKRADEEKWYGTYEKYTKRELDTRMVQKAIETGEKQNYTEIINGKIQLQFRHTEDQYVPSGIYETPVIDFGENTKQILKLQTSIYIPTASANQNKAEVYIYTSTSPDNQTFSDWQLLNPDGTIASPAGRYLRIKIELKAEREQELNQVNTSVEYDPSKVIVVTDNYTLKDQDRLLKLVYNILDTMPIEYDATKIQKGLDYYVLQGNVQ